MTKYFVTFYLFLAHCQVYGLGWSEFEKYEDSENISHKPSGIETKYSRRMETKTFSETDGAVIGKAIFQLEKKEEGESFRIVDPNPWIKVTTSGEVQVKKKWDFEALSSEKTIVFDVVSLASSGENGKQKIVLKITDVNDEVPFFINRPLPMQTVVELNATPNTPVFYLRARDLDDDADIHYFLVRDRTGGRFEVDEKSGVVRTRGTEMFQLDMEYVLYVKAEDHNGRNDDNSFQFTAEERLSIVGGKRPPQFYLPKYEKTIPENATIDQNIVTVRAKSFNDREIRYSLKAKGQGAGTFNIGPTSGIVKLTKELDFEDVTQPHIYQFQITATEDYGGLSASVDLTLNVTDVNDNAPKFDRSDYEVSGIDEDISIGSSILKVKAKDVDTGVNAEIVYSVSSDHFRVDNEGIVYNSEILDADDNNAYYEFTVTASDKSEPPQESTATIRIYTKNKNDEKPMFSQQVYTPNVDENAGRNTLVTTVVASDKDGDSVEFGLVGGTSDSGQFVIERMTGVIRLHNGPISLDRDKYELNVTAVDDGTCCPGGSLNRHTSTAVVVVFITDVNDNKPVFNDCPSYHAKMEESAPIGSSVFTVHATDLDKGINGQIRYSVVQQPNKKGINKFTVNQETGEVTTNKVFDREGEDGKFVYVIIKATDNGDPSLEGVCSFAVEITDINDNPPLFERMKYTHSVEKSTEIGAKVFRVSAFDGDAENNGTVVYNLISPTNIVGPVYFEIEPESGWIILRAPLDRDCYVLRVEASDMGDPPLNSSVLVELNVFDQVSRPPMWFQSVYGPYYTPENTRVGQTLVSVFARSLMEDNPTIFYGIVSDSNEQSDKYFYIDERPDDGRIWADIKLKHPFDYETKKSYNLTIFGQYNLTLAATDDVRNDTTTVLIYIIKSKEKSAHVHLKFEQSFYQTSIMEEEDRGLPKFILEAKVIDDEDRKRDIVYFLSGQGIDVENPEDSVFEINKTTGAIYVRKALDRDFPNGRPVWRFLVFAQDVDGDGPVGYADVEVKLMDINDNAPIFPQILYFGNVTENGTNGMYVMTMTAVDYDDPSEGNNAKLEYSIEKNVIHEEFGSPIFDIDSETGVIKTFICCIDREKTSDFSIQVVAEDGGGLRGTGTASIRVRDINDMPPKFTKDEWVIEVDETYGEVLPDQAILTVTVQDDDETNKFHYKVIESSGFGADKFTMVTNNDGTGSLKIVQPLDYEDPMQSSGFKFKIQVNDKGEDNDAEKYHVAYSWVKVELRDINDNKPQFIKPNIEVPVFENAEVGKSLEKFKAEDPDQGGNSKVSYAIDRSSDRRRQFIIDDNGVVRIQRNLDREENPRHSVKILAIDDGTPAKTATATLTVIVADINDNAPRFLKDYRPVLPENQSPRKIVEVLATDDDDRSKGNGPPFHFRLDSTASDEIRASFKVEHIPKGANGDGMGLISSLRSFDREYIKEYHVPIIIKDAGTPPITGTSTLTIVIGDENDNKMQSGFKEISVYKCIKDNDDHMPIGRVYVNDLDDWDLTDKLFAWADSSPHPNFSLNKDDGMISMRRGTHEGAHFLRFHVYDRKHTQTEVEANVTVTVKEITEEAIINSGSIRIANISAEDFVRIWDYKSQRVVQSKYSIFKDEIAKLVGTHSDNVDVFSVQTYQSRPPITDVRFAAHGSPYYQPVKLNGLVLQHRAKIENRVGINITMVSIDECLYENKACEGSCTNNLVVSSYPYMVNANKTSFVGVRTQVIPECTCGARNFSREESCRPNPCFNGGRCSASTAGVRCDCPPGFDGPRCQMTTRSFVGNGYAWFTPIKICDNSHISLEFISSRKDGLILYNGPITEPETDGIVVSDFISLELMDGRPRLLIDFGSGTLELKVNTRNPLSDGEWHRIDIFWDTEIVRIDVDHCIKATIYEPEDGNDPIFDSSECQARGVIPPFNEYLNVNSPLQLGGLATKVPDPTLFNWQYVPTQGKSFHGCIRNLIVNSELYDLNNPGDSKGTQSGCPQLEEPCRNINPKCSFNGICDGSVEEPICKCKPGWTGPSCEEKTNPSFFESQSYVKCALSFKPNFFKTEFQLRFRTWQEYGELFRISDQHSREYGILAIKDGHLRFSYNLNSLRTEEHDLWLSSITVNDGQWHAVSVERHGSTAMLMLDGGEGRRFNETTVFAGHMLMDVDKLEGVYFGGKTEYTGIRTFEVYNDFKLGCLDDIRLNGKHLPLPPGLNGTPWGQVTMFRHLRSNCVPHNMCLSVTCPAAYTCKNLWMRYECV